MDTYKKGFSEFTQKDVNQFKEQLKSVYEDYVNNGPDASHVTLAEGLAKLEEYKELVLKYNRIKEDKVLAEKLFNLPISKYDELIAIE